MDWASPTRRAWTRGSRRPRWCRRPSRPSRARRRRGGAGRRPWARAARRPRRWRRSGRRRARLARRLSRRPRGSGPALWACRPWGAGPRRTPQTRGVGVIGYGGCSPSAPSGTGRDRRGLRRGRGPLGGPGRRRGCRSGPCRGGIRWDSRRRGAGRRSGGASESGAQPGVPLPLAPGARPRKIPSCPAGTILFLGVLD